MAIAFTILLLDVLGVCAFLTVALEGSGAKAITYVSALACSVSLRKMAGLDRRPDFDLDGLIQHARCFGKLFDIRSSVTENRRCIGFTTRV